MPDFSLLQMPNFAQAALGGYQAGQAIGRQKRLDAALGGVDFARPETIMPVLQADPALGASLIGAAGKMADAQRDAAGRAALSGYLMDRLGKGAAKGGGQTISAAGSGVAATASSLPSPDSQPGDIVVTANRQQPSAEEQLIRSDPQAWLDVQGNLGKLDENHRKAIAEAADAQGTVAMGAMKLPYEQRRAYIQQNMPYLAAHGVSQAEIDAFDPTDAALQAQSDQALGVKGILDQRNKAADDARADATLDLSRQRFQHDVSHDAETLAVSRGNLAVSQGNLALSRQREGRVAAGASSGGGAAPAAIATPTSRAAYNALAKGTRYRAPDGSMRIKN